MDEATTFHDIIGKIRSLAIEKYDSKPYDHALDIFKELTQSEQNLLLKSLLNICFIIEKEMLMTDDRYQQIQAQFNEINEKLNTEVIDVDSLNEQEMIKLKTWLIKTMVIVMSVGFMGSVTLALISSNEDSSLFKALEDGFEIIKAVFN